MNKNSNTYIIVYSTVMVVIVAALLSIASLSLQSRQMENERNEKKANILISLDLDPATTDFDRNVSAFLIGGNGEKTPIGAEEVFGLMSSNESLRDAIHEGKYILFETSDGRVVIPIIGKGLWDDIWGYVALQDDMNTVSGIVLAHKGETPGLGAEIATPAHQAMYRGKQLFSDGEFVSVTLRKGGAKDPLHEVDAISGGTKTSDGVTAMLRECLIHYVPFFRLNVRQEADTQVADTVNDQNTASHE